MVDLDAKDSTTSHSVALALALMLVIFELGWIALNVNRPLLLPDEPREAAVTLEMARAGEWAVPTLNGAPFVEKPPLIYAASALVSNLARSEAPGILRAPHTLAALLTLAATVALGRRLGSAAAGLTCALLLATMSSFASVSLRLVVDIGLAAFVATSVLFTLEWWLAEGRARRAAWLGLTCVSLALGVSTKGPAALVFHSAAALGLLVAGGRHASGRLLWLVPVYLIALLPLGVWAIVLMSHGGRELAVEALLRNSWGRFASAELGHRAPPWFYLQNVPIVLAPWSLLALAGVSVAWRGAFDRSGPRPRSTLLCVAITWAIASTLLLSVSAAKRQIYLLPAAPAWAILAGALLDHTLRLGRAEGVTRVALVLTTGGLAIASFAVGAYTLVQGHLEGALLLPLAAVFAVLVRASFARWHPWAAVVLLAGVALAPVVLVRARTEREADRSIEQAWAAIARAAVTADRVYGLSLGERGESLVSLALRRHVLDVEDIQTIGGLDAPLAVRTLVISVGETPPPIGATLGSRASIESAGSTPFGDRHRMYWFMLTAAGPRTEVD